MGLIIRVLLVPDGSASPPVLPDSTKCFLPSQITHILVPPVCANSLQGPSWKFMSHLVYVDTPSVARRCFSFLIYPQEQPIMKFSSFKATAEFFGEDIALRGHVSLWPLWLELLLLLCGLVGFLSQNRPQMDKWIIHWKSLVVSSYLNNFCFIVLHL